MSLKMKIGTAIAGFTAGVGILTGGTLAMFTDTASNGPNTFTAGTLTLADLNEGQVFQSALYVNNLAPGDREDGVVTIQNTGSLDAWVSISGIDTGGHGGGLHHGDHPEDGTGPMSLFGGETPLILTFDNGPNNPVLIPAGKTANLKVHYYMPLEAGNGYQGKPASGGFYVQAVQVRNNVKELPASWGNQ